MSVSDIIGGFLLIIDPFIIPILTLGFIVAITRWYLKGFYAARNDRARTAEEQRNRHGGESVLEWVGNYDHGVPDVEFGRLVVEVPKKNGKGSAQFYEKGLVLPGEKRLPYSEIRDVICKASDIKKNPDLLGRVNDIVNPDLRKTVRDMGVLWIYRKKGSTIGLRELNYVFDNDTMEAIQHGLGYSRGQHRRYDVSYRRCFF